MIATIYRIYSPSSELVYIGSSVNSLKSRFSSHKTTKKRWLSGESTQCCYSFRVLDFPDAAIESLEVLVNCPKHVVRERERHYMELDKVNCVNHNNPIRTRTEQLAQYKKHYYANIDAIKLHNSTKKTCECGTILSTCSFYSHVKTAKHKAQMKLL